MPNECFVFPISSLLSTKMPKAKDFLISQKDSFPLTKNLSKDTLSTLGPNELKLLQMSWSCPEETLGAVTGFIRYASRTNQSLPPPNLYAATSNYIENFNRISKWWDFKDDVRMALINQYNHSPYFEKCSYQHNIQIMINDQEQLYKKLLDKERQKRVAQQEQKSLSASTESNSSGNAIGHSHCFSQTSNEQQAPTIEGMTTKFTNLFESILGGGKQGSHNPNEEDTTIGVGRPHFLTPNSKQRSTPAKKKRPNFIDSMINLISSPICGNGIADAPDSEQDIIQEENIHRSLLHDELEEVKVELSQQDDIISSYHHSYQGMTNELSQMNEINLSYKNTNRQLNSKIVEQQSEIHRLQLLLKAQETTNHQLNLKIAEQQSEKYRLQLQIESQQTQIDTLKNNQKRNNYVEILKSTHTQNEKKLDSYKKLIDLFKKKKFTEPNNGFSRRLLGEMLALNPNVSFESVSVIVFLARSQLLEASGILGTGDISIEDVANTSPGEMVFRTLLDGTCADVLFTAHLELFEDNKIDGEASAIMSTFDKGGRNNNLIKVLSYWNTNLGKVGHIILDADRTNTSSEDHAKGM